MVVAFDLEQKESNFRTRSRVNIVRAFALSHFWPTVRQTTQEA
jgi:hypothetical protein